MIRVQKIAIKEFRGIRDLTIDFGAKNFAICGPNGTGKSGIVDALEFALTGSVSRLSGKGTKEVSIKEHAPHVDSRAKPKNAVVTVTLQLAGVKKPVTVERSVSSAGAPTISDNSAQTLAVLQLVSEHPEFVLSRRELIDYVLATPGDRAKEVQALLRLDSIETMRANLLKIANALKKSVDPLKKEKELANDNLLKALNIPALQKQQALAAVNAKRTMLGLEPLTEWTATISVKDGLTVAKAAVAPVAKVQATKDVQHLKELSASVADKDAKTTISGTIKQLETLKGDRALLASSNQVNLLRAALNLISDSGCPVCDTEWNPEELKQHVAGKLKKFREVSDKRQKIAGAMQPVQNVLVDAKVSLDTAVRYATSLKLNPVKTQLSAALDGVKAQLKVLEDLNPTDETINSLTSLLTLSKTWDKPITDLATAVAAIPEPTEMDAAREYLTVVQERLEHFRGISRRLKAAEDQAELAKVAYHSYAKVSTELLDGVYQGVAKEFGELYSYINSDDEKGFTARLTPSMGKLGFDVDFYGRGYFPPGAYHSEGHQDGMGLCLYLALMKNLLGDGFKFAVLDDVLMSVDTGHRREVCNLLKDKFPDTQFVLTTHDPIWLKHMRTVGLIAPKNLLHFRNWSVDHGPADWEGRDVWAEIDAALKAKDVNGAAGILRRYLEYYFKEVCHALRAPVVFRGDAQYQLGDVLPSAIGQTSKLIKKGIKAAQSWGNNAEKTKLAALDKAFSDAATATNVDQWQINTAIHYNEWENFNVADFKPVVASFKALCGFFACDSEGCGLLYVSPDGPQSEQLKCSCAKTAINLKEK